MELPSSALLSSSSKKQKNPPRKNFFILGNGLIFQEEAFQAQKIKKMHSKKVLTFPRKYNFSYILGNGTFLYFLKKVCLTLPGNRTF